ncbi:MAG: hypothetical protein IPK22_11010 [Verrucomicrobiaceae bacterium]|nr:hypothetical protein [Verrucomicrobiaceae bacterium]
MASGGDLWLTGGSNLNSGSSVSGAGKVTLGGTTINSGSTSKHYRRGSPARRQHHLQHQRHHRPGHHDNRRLQLTRRSAEPPPRSPWPVPTHRAAASTIVTGGAVIDGGVFNLNGGELKGTGIIASSLIAGAGSNTISPGLSLAR